MVRRKLSGIAPPRLKAGSPCSPPPRPWQTLTRLLGTTRLAWLTRQTRLTLTRLTLVLTRLTRVMTRQTQVLSA